MAMWTTGESGRKRGTVVKPTDAQAVQKRYEAGFLDSMDGRAEVTRTLRQRLGQLVADLGGVSNLSYMEQSICKRVVHLERLIEKRELTAAHGGAVDETLQLATINCLSGLFGKLGLKRRAKQISLKDYLTSKPEPPPAPPPPSTGHTPEGDQ